jgi:hypothetical protein
MHDRPRMHFDLHARDHGELAMGFGELDASHRIAEGIELVHAPMMGGHDVDLVLEAFLESRRSRHQVQQVVRVDDVRGIFVTRFVPDAVSAFHARVTSPTRARRVRSA